MLVNGKKFFEGDTKLGGHRLVLLIKFKFLETFLRWGN
jgi:hypothetical protein